MARPKKNPLTVINRCPTCGKDFNIKYEKKHQVYCSKTCAQHAPSVLNKMRESQKKTYLKKYGVEHPMQTKKVQDTFKRSMLNKYGVDHPAKMPNFIINVKATLKDRYGIENYNNIKKIKSTMLSRYGVDNPQKSKTIVEQTTLTKKSNHYDFLINFCKDKKLELLCSKVDYKGYHFSNLYKLKCLNCNKILETTVYNLNNLFCDYCEPEKITTVENKFYKFLQEIVDKETIIKRNDRTILVGKELDFYIPDKKYAFEINGLYWHSENSGETNRLYHLNKTKSCAYHGINLIHIFENEWLYKEEIVKSIIKNLLNVSVIDKINARECSIIEVTEKEKNEFLNRNHLQGEDKSTIKIGLYHKTDLVSIMTFRKGSRFEKCFQWELTRFCNKTNTIVNGGASKLFVYFIQNYAPKNIVSYCDRRYFHGNLYKKLGFNFVDHTPPGYSYIINNYKDLKNRMSFQKHKLKKILKTFDPKLSEWENMKLNGYDRIWDCGNSKWIFTNRI
jgi:hypothetical protein